MQSIIIKNIMYLIDEAIHNNLYDYGIANKVIEFIDRLQNGKY